MLEQNVYEVIRQNISEKVLTIQTQKEMMDYLKKQRDWLKANYKVEMLIDGEKTLEEMQNE